MTATTISAGGRPVPSIVLVPDRGWPPNAGPQHPPCPQAVALLSQVVARLGPSVVPAVQFVPGSDHDGADRVARAFAVACILRFGRTLLISSERWDQVELPDGPADLRSAPESSAVVCLPDSQVAGLHHLRLDRGSRVESLLERLRGPDPEFGMLVVDSLFPACCPATLAVAPHCCGSVVTVASGVTGMSDLLMVVRTLQASGAKVMGTVLCGARYQRGRPSWQGAAA